MRSLLLVLLVFISFYGVCSAQNCSVYNCHASDAYGKTGSHNFQRVDGSTGPCEPCHKPHNASNLIPLWNDANKYDDGPAYTAYSSPSGTIDNTIDSTINPASEACMACHDGMSESTGYTAAYFQMVAMGRLDIDYSKANHPIGVVYDATKDAGLNPSVSNGKVVGVSGSFKLINNKVECLTCHDPHKKGPAGTDMLFNGFYGISELEAIPYNKLLRTTDVKTFCNECHITK